MAGASSVAKSVVKFVIGHVKPSFKTTAAKISIPKFEYDENLRMHFRTYEEVYAHDPEKICKTGDTVLIQSLPEKMTRLITHRVVEVIYPLGNITDPITGKKVAASIYRDDLKETSELYGKSEHAFDYDRAPSRGYLEDKRDFTNKPTYTKYHEDQDDPQPYAVK